MRTLGSGRIPLLVAVAVVFALAGCGGGGSSESTAVGSSTPTPATPAETASTPSTTTSPAIRVPATGAMRFAYSTGTAVWVAELDGSAPLRIAKRNASNGL